MAATGSELRGQLRKRSSSPYPGPKSVCPHQRRGREVRETGLEVSVLKRITAIIRREKTSMP